VRLQAHLEFERAEAERAAQWEQLPDLDATITEVEEMLSGLGLRGHLTPKDREPKPRKARSTKWRRDTPELPVSLVCLFFRRSTVERYVIVEHRIKIIAVSVMKLVPSAYASTTSTLILRSPNWSIVVWRCRYRNDQ
jgi:hypothetical protein